MPERRSILLLSLLFWGLMAAASPMQAEWSLVSQNLNRFFDDIDDPEEDRVLKPDRYRQRVDQLAKRIEKNFDLPEVIALQEIENRRILEDVARTVERDTGRHYRAVLIDGNDISGMDVGYLVSDRLELRRVEALFTDRRYRYRKKGRTVIAPLFARPPLLIEWCRDRCMVLINLHLRSIRGLRHRSKGKRIALKRKGQAEALARWIDEFQRRNPRHALALVGDFNALRPSDRHVDVLGILLGQPDTERPRNKSRDLIADDLVDASERLPKGKRYSYRYKKRRQQLDYLLLNRVAEPWLRRIEFGRIDYRFSDHAALRAEFDQP